MVFQCSVFDRLRLRSNSGFGCSRAIEPTAPGPSKPRYFVWLLLQSYRIWFSSHLPSQFQTKLMLVSSPRCFSWQTFESQFIFVGISVLTHCCCCLFFVVGVRSAGSSREGSQVREAGGHRAVQELRQELEGWSTVVWVTVAVVTERMHRQRCY